MCALYMLYIVHYNHVVHLCTDHVEALIEGEWHSFALVADVVMSGQEPLKGVPD